MEEQFNKLIQSGKNSADGLVQWLKDVVKMEAQFDKLIQAGKNTLDALIQWLKDAKIIDGVKVTEEKAREVFSEVSDPKNVNFEAFKEGLNKLASNQKESLEQFSKTLATEGPRILDALKAGASAFKDALTKK